MGVELVKKQDIAAIYQYLNTVAKQTDYLTFDSSSLTLSLAEFEQAILQQLASANTVYFCYKLDGKIIGLINLQIYPKTKMAHRATLGISVLAEYQNQGVGNALLTALIAYAKQVEQLELLELEVACENTAAIHLYEKFGFKKIGELPRFFKMNQRYLDFIMMQLDLTSSK